MEKTPRLVAGDRVRMAIPHQRDSIRGLLDANPIVRTLCRVYGTFGGTAPLSCLRVYTIPDLLADIGWNTMLSRFHWR